MKKILLLLMAGACIMACSTKKGDQVDLKYLPVGYDDDGKIYLDVSTGKKAENSRRYDNASYFVNGIAIVENEDSLQFINSKFDLISKDKYAEVTYFSDGIAYAVKTNGRIQAIDKSGKVVFTLPDAEYAYRFKDGVSIFMTSDGKYGLVNTSGKILIEPGEFDEIGAGTNGMIRVAKETKSGRKWGIFTHAKKEVIPCEYENIDFASDNTFLVEKNDKYGLVDMKNREIIGKEYSALFIEDDGMILFGKYYKSKGTRYGWMNKKGEETIDPSFEDVYPFNGTVGFMTFSGNLAAAERPSSKSDRTWGYIDKKGEWVIEPKFQSATSFIDKKFALVENEDDEWGVINVKGEYIVKPRYSRVEYFGDGLIWVYNDGEEGIINAKGETVVKLSDSYDFSFPQYALYDFDRVQSQYVDVDAVVDLMMKQVQRLSVMPFTRENIADEFDVQLDSYGRKTLSYDSNDYFTSKLSAFVDYDYDYSFYTGSYYIYYLTNLKAEFNFTSSKVYKNSSLIFNKFAKKLGADCKMEAGGNVTGDRTFKLSSIPGCKGYLDYDFEVSFTPESGKIE